MLYNMAEKVSQYYVIKRDGRKEPVHFDKITQRIYKLLDGKMAKNIDVIDIVKKTITSIYPGITTVELDNQSAYQCAMLTTKHYDYALLAGRIYISSLHKETAKTFVEKMEFLQEKLNIYDTEWMDFIKKYKSKLNKAIDYNRDYQLDFFGVKTMERTYITKYEGQLIERPQDVFMRVATLVHCGDLQKTIESYNLMSKKYFTHASPTLFNAGNKHGNLVSCFLLGTEDSISGIAKTWNDVSHISKWGGGIGIHVSNIRAKGSKIRGTNGHSDGIIPMLQVYNSICRYVNQCFTPDTLIYFEEGTKQIKDIQVNDLVTTHDGSLKPVKKVFKREINEEILQINNLKCTKVHKILIMDKITKEISYKYAEEIKIGDSLLFPKYVGLKYGYPQITKDFCSNIITNITKFNYNGYVYDLNIEENHNYLTSSGIVHNSGKRKGSFAIYLEPHHADVFEFLELRKNTGAESERARDLFLALWIPDLFMKQVKSDGDWYLFCPDKAPGLNDVYGEEYETLYWKYVEEEKYNNKIPARKLWEAIMTSQFETGSPYITYKDNVNRKTNQKNIGIIKSSNLCVAPETKILTKSGYKIISELKNKKCEVWNGTEWSEVEVKQTGKNQELCKVIFDDYTELECTPYHKFYIQESYWKKPVIKEAKDLKKNDKIIKCNYPVIDNEIVLKSAYTDGFFSGEIKNNKLNETLKASIMKEKIFVPQGYNIESKLDWFAGYCDADGSITTNQECQSLQICCIELNFLKDIKLMLNTCGINPKISLMSKKRQTLLQDNNKKSYRLVINSVDLNTLVELGFNPKRLIINRNIQNKDVRKFTKIKCVEITNRIDDTYCFTEEKEHKGIFNGIITGQCNEIVEYSDTNETAACNLASIALSNFVRNKQIDSDDWVIYSKKECPYCNWAKRLLSSNNIEFNEIIVEAGDDNYNILKGKQSDPLDKITFPQVYHKDNLIGGMEDLYVYFGKEFDYEKLWDVSYHVTQNLDKVIDKNYYPTTEARRSNMKHRPIGLGIQGLADTLAMMRVPYASEKMKEINEKIFGVIYHASLQASVDISKEREELFIQLNEYFKEHPKKKPIGEFYDDKFECYPKKIEKIYHKLRPHSTELEKTKFLGSYSTFEGSPFSEGKLQYHLWDRVPIDISQLLEGKSWGDLIDEIKKYGTRNSLLTALMPTASTSQLLGNFESFEAFTSNMYTRRTLAGEFIVVNKHLINDLTDIGEWNERAKNNVIINNGSVQGLKIPKIIKDNYLTAYEIKQKYILDGCIARGAYIDQTQSMNLYFAEPDSRKLTSSQFYAWEKGLKTGLYYLRSKPSANATKITVDEDEGCLMCSA